MSKSVLEFSIALGNEKWSDWTFKKNYYLKGEAEKALEYSITHYQEKYGYKHRIRREKPRKGK